MKSNSLVSIIIPCNQVADFLIQKTIPAIVNQSYKKWEIIIITNQKTSLKFPKTKIIFTKEISPSRKRNLGTKNANGNFFAFIDDDVYPHKNWLKNIIAQFKNNPKISGLCGPNLTPPKSNLRQRMSAVFWQSPLGAGNLLFRSFPQKTRIVDDYPSSNLIIKKFTFNRIGGYNCKYWPGEDTKLCHDISYVLGEKLLYHPSIKVYHEKRQFPWQHLKQLNRYAIHRGFYVKYLPKTSRLPIYFIPSLLSLYILFLPGIYLVKLQFNLLNYLSLLPLILYTTSLITNAIWVQKNHKSSIITLLSIPVVLVSHLSYGLFFIVGLFQKDLKR